MPPRKGRGGVSKGITKVPKVPKVKGVDPSAEYHAKFSPLPREHNVPRGVDPTDDEFATVLEESEDEYAAWSSDGMEEGELRGESDLEDESYSCSTPGSSGSEDDDASSTGGSPVSGRKRDRIGRAAMHRAMYTGPQLVLESGDEEDA